MRISILLLLLLSLIGCSSDGENNLFTSVELFINNSTFTVDEPGVIDLKITGDANTITIEAGNNIYDFELIGSNNLVTFQPTVSVIGSFEITGSDNTIQIPIGSGITFNAVGSGNMLIEI